VIDEVLQVQENFFLSVLFRNIAHLQPCCWQAAAFIVLQILTWSVCYSSKFTFHCYTVSIAIWFFLHLCLMSACFKFVDVWAVSVMAEKVVVIVFAFHNFWVYVHPVHIYGTVQTPVDTPAQRPSLPLVPSANPSNCSIPVSTRKCPTKVSRSATATFACKTFHMT